jgi:hypothetical protein
LQVYGRMLFMNERQPTGEQPQRGIRRFGEKIVNKFGFGKKTTPEVQPGAPQQESQPKLDTPEMQPSRQRTPLQNTGEGEAKVKPGEYGSREWAEQLAQSTDIRDAEWWYNCAGARGARGEPFRGGSDRLPQAAQGKDFEERSKRALDEEVNKLRKIADDPSHPMSQEVQKDIAEIELLERQRLRFLDKTPDQSSEPRRRRRRRFGR